MCVLQLFAYDQVKGFLGPKDGKPGMLASLPVSPVAGACAGISSTVCMYPLELLKTRLTIQVNTPCITAVSKICTPSILERLLIGGGGLGHLKVRN